MGCPPPRVSDTILLDIGREKENRGVYGGGHQHQIVSLCVKR
jgi:hypothetical protein